MEKAKKIIKWIWYSFVIVAIGLIVWRVIYSSDRTYMKAITPTENAVAAYRNGDDILTHKITQSISDNGMMSCYGLVYIPSSGELQITVKANNSMYENISEEEQIDFFIYNTESKEKIYSESVERVKKGIYTYFRVIFEEAEFDAKKDSIEIVMTDSSGTEDYSVFKLHEIWSEFKNYKLSAKEKKSLGG